MVTTLSAPEPPGREAVTVSAALIVSLAEIVTNVTGKLPVPLFNVLFAGSVA